MPAQRPTTIPDYIEAAPPAGQPHLRRIYEILKKVAPDAEETIKWNVPFFVEPRFLFSFSAHKAHLGFTAQPNSLDPFREELEAIETTKMGIVKIRYEDPLPEDLIRRIAERQLELVSQRDGDGFWP